MTDDEEPDEDESYVRVVFDAREDVLERLTTAAATQGMSLDDAINVAMQHYELSLSTKPGQTLRWTDADNMTRRFYFVPAALPRWENVMGFSVAVMILGGPPLLLSPWFFPVWLTGALIFWVAVIKVR